MGGRGEAREGERQGSWVGEAGLIMSVVWVEDARGLCSGDAHTRSKVKVRVRVSTSRGGAARTIDSVRLGRLSSRLSSRASKGADGPAERGRIVAGSGGASRQTMPVPSVARSSAASE